MLARRAEAGRVIICQWTSTFTDNSKSSLLQSPSSRAGDLHVFWGGVGNGISNLSLLNREPTKGCFCNMCT